MQDLIERLTRAAEPDADLDGLIAEMTGCEFHAPHWWRVNGVWQLGSPPYTSSIDAALPDESIVSMVWFGPGHPWKVVAVDQHGVQHSGSSLANEAIARRVAALRARTALSQRTTATEVNS